MIIEIVIDSLTKTLDVPEHVIQSICARTGGERNARAGRESRGSFHPFEVTVYPHDGRGVTLARGLEQIEKDDGASPA